MCTSHINRTNQLTSNKLYEIPDASPYYVFMENFSYLDIFKVAQDCLITPGHAEELLRALLININPIIPFVPYLILRHLSHQHDEYLP